MKRSSSIPLFFIAHLVLLMMFMVAPASVMAQDMTITTIEQLQEIGNNASYPLNGYYALGGDIDASATRSWNSGAGFAPIGTDSTAFSGSLDGKGYAIHNLYINRGGADYVGLFGYISGGLATIANLALDNATITGRNYTGALIGYNNKCLIKKCSSTGSVSGIENVGGLVGWSTTSPPNSISDCYSTSAVSGNGGVGGLVGRNENTPISTSYSAGRVSGSESWVGALIGYNFNAAVTNCFWDNSTSGQKISAGGTPKSTADMKKRSTFFNAGWDFTSIWGIIDTTTYPFFRGANDLPQAEPDWYSAGRNAVLTIKAPGVLANDSDADGDPLTAILVSDTSHGTLSLKADGAFTYTPDKDFIGTDGFTYKALAGGDNTTAVTVTLIIGNTAPVANSDNYTVNRNLPLFVLARGGLDNDSDSNGLFVFPQGVLDNDTDPNGGDNLTAVLVAGPKHGTLNLKKNGSFIYTPHQGYFGTDNFTYSAYDGELYSSPAVVFINVTRICLLLPLYGEDAPEVETLRRYRDEVLAASAAGRALINLYYSISPLAEDVLENSPRLQRMVKKTISRALPGIQERLQEGP